MTKKHCKIVIKNSINKFNKKLLTLFIFLLTIEAFAGEFSGKFSSIEYPEMKTINLGPCLIGESVFTSFELRNTGTETLRMLGVSPSIEFYASPSAITPFEFLRFTYSDISLPKNFVYPVDMVDTLTVKYSAENDIISFPLGRKETLMKLGFVNPNDTTEIIRLDTFLLTARKTKYYVDGFDEFINFDSVYVNSESLNMNWKVKNTWSKNVTAFAQTDSLISQPMGLDEFTFENKNYPLTFYAKKSYIDWGISYSPKDTKADTAVLNLEYQPDPALFPDSVDIAWVKLFGIGVKQELKASSSEVEIKGDTIYLGDIRTGTNKTINFKILNTGNIPFGSLNESVIKEYQDILFTDFTIKKGMPSKNILPNENVDISIDFNATISGDFVARYKISSDILNRKSLHNVPNSQKEIFLYIKGRAVEPRLQINVADTVKFGNVVFSADVTGDCPSERDTLITIYNNGNLEVKVFDIVTDPDNLFIVSPTSFIINAGSSKKININYTATPPAREDYSVLSIISDQKIPNDTLSFVLSAASVPPVLAELGISKDIRSKPGRTIAVPVLLTNEYYTPAIYAKNCKFNLTYNPSLLKYENKTTINTAVEGASSVVTEDATGKLSVLINKDDYFSAKDTLIILTFKTYLGDNISTEMAFSEPVFGDGKCNQTLYIVTSNGIFSLDSVCGLEYKAYPYNSKITSIKNISPNPTSGLTNIEIFLGYQMQCNMSISNVYGEIVYEPINSVMPAGSYNFKVDLSIFPPGNYYCCLTAGNYSATFPIILIK